MGLESLMITYIILTCLVLAIGAAILYRILDRLEEQCDMLHTLAAFLLAKNQKNRRKDK